MVGEALDAYVGDVLRVPEEAFRDVLLFNIEIDLALWANYVDQNEIIVVLSHLLLLLSEIITQSDHVEFIQQLKIWVELLAVLDIRLHIFVSRLVKLLRLE